MKAALITRYGSPDVVKVGEAPKPAPAADEILVRVHAASVNRTDCGELRAHPVFMRLFTGLRRPRRSILGLDFAGEVEAVGAAVTSFKSGERVFGMCPSRGAGAQAEYVCVPERAVAAMPAGARFDEAVVCEGAFYATTVLRKFELAPGRKILIYGASGAIGTAMVQLAKSSGAEVTAVVATPQLELVTSLGADRAIDYTAGDFTRIGETFDYVVDAVGKTTFFRCRRLLKPDGVFAATDLGPWGQNLVLAMWSSITGRNRVFIAAPGRIEGFVGNLKGRMEAGQFRAVIDRRYPLDAIADAYRYVETGKKIGIVLIDVTAPGVQGQSGEIGDSPERDLMSVISRRLRRRSASVWSIST
jgi:NADPH:quinone reductase-like Zn-dependent oxidoreductase